MKLWSTALAVLILGAVAQMAWAGDCGCCQGCGCQCQCRKVTCRIVCEVKKEKYHFFTCECEPFCLPGPGHKVPLCGCEPCGCGQCGCKQGCGCAPCGCVAPNCHQHEVHHVWQPSWCHLYHKKVLKKYECEKEIPCYKCIVVDLCPSCCAAAHSSGAIVGEGDAAGPAKEPVPSKDEPMPPKVPSAQRRSVLDIMGLNFRK